MVGLDWRSEPQPGCGWKIEKSIKFGAVSMGLTLGHRRQQGKKNQQHNF